LASYPVLKSKIANKIVIVMTDHLPDTNEKGSFTGIIIKIGA
jgi:hypothetical protein